MSLDESPEPRPAPVVWVTGARGFIGRHLTRQLAMTGHRVLALGHGSWPAELRSAWGAGYWLNGEINGQNLRQLFHEGGAPAAVFHLAGGSSVRPSFENPLEDFHRTVTTTAGLLEWIRTDSPTTRVVCASSAAVYGDGHAGCISEGSALNPCSPYAVHKAMMEGVCRSYSTHFGLQIAAVRLFSIYGEGLEKQLLWDLCARLSGGTRELVLSGSGEELRDWLHVSDAARLLGAVGTRPREGFAAINGGTGRGTSVRELATRVLHAWGSDARLTFNGEVREGDPRSLVADVTAMKALGFEPETGLDESLPATVDWYKARLRFQGSASATEPRPSPSA